MCGICGFVNIDGASASAFAEDLPRTENLLERMVGTLRHRGPDDVGAVVFDSGALGMARLEVIDLTTGHQPIANDDRTCWIVYNGEVYNFGELRSVLRERGYRFRTSSDTEVILRAYEEWGDDCVERLRGMFSFAVYDLRRPARPRLFLARDRLGQKPLYYFEDDKWLVFGSEIKAILCHPAVPREVRRDHLPLYLVHGYVPAPSTLFEGIRELPPGHTATLEKGALEIERYWAPPLPSADGFDLPFDECAAEVRRLLDDAVRDRLVSDVPLGAFLSGGLDSSAIVARMARHLDRPVKTFAIGFADEPSYNELGHAEYVARWLQSDHHSLEVTADDVADLLPKLVWHHDQPFGDSSAIPTFIVSRLAREHVKVALTGDGGDEFFAGYRRFTALRALKTWHAVPAFVQKSIASVFAALPESTAYGGPITYGRRFSAYADLSLPKAYLRWVGTFTPESAREVLADNAGVDPDRHFQRLWATLEHPDPLIPFLHLNATTYLPGDLLVKVDRMSMANSLEARSPFLDHELVEFAARVPATLKLRRFTRKYLLKEALRGALPDRVVDRKKHGFSVPIGKWLRGVLAPLLKSTLLSEKASHRSYFDQRRIEALVQDHLEERADFSHHLWTLLTFELWHRMFLDEFDPSHSEPSTKPLANSLVDRRVERDHL